MSLDGLRAWIGEVERKLGMRTRVFLVLAAIAVGGAGAAIYLAIEAQEGSVSKADVQALRDELEERIGAESGEADLTALEAQLGALQAEVAQLRDEGGGAKGTAGDSSKSSGGGAKGAGGDSAGTSGGGGTGTTGPGRKQLLESIQKAMEQAGK
jgi:hypothetical protein